MNKKLFTFHFSLFILAACGLTAVYVVLTPGEGITFSDEPPSPPDLRPTSLVASGDFPRYVVARSRSGDGAKAPLLVFASALRAQAAAEKPPQGWQTIPVEPWQLERLEARTGKPHIGVPSD